MAQKRRNKIIRFAFHAALLLLAYILQGMVFTNITLWGMKPLILPVAVVGAAMFGGMLEGGILGLAAGMLCDVSFNQPAIVFTLLLTGVGLILGWLFETYLSRSLPACLIASAAVLIISAFVQMFDILVFDRVGVLPLLDTALRQTLYSLLFVLPTYYIYGRLGRLSQ